MDLRITARRRWQRALAVHATPMKRVLIVEDDADLRDMMAMLLHLEGFETVAAANGALALQLLDVRLDAIVLDLMMPVMDGWEFRRRQLSHPKAADIPVIVVSAVNPLRQGGTVPCAAHLSKPVDFDRLIRTLAAVCRMPARA
jgi:CheY-like chemotaxis protein